ncbi:MAG: hypothetical protein ACE5HE_06025, partial [Phycisphaerae bacterium]
ATGAPPPCPPNTGSAECRQKVVGYPDSCPASPDPVLCSATCPPGQYDWGAGLFPSGSFDPNGINDSHNDGDAYFVNQIAFGASLPSVSTTQSLWVARFAFTVQSGQGQQTEITFDLCQPEGGVAPTLTRVLGAGASMVTGDLTGLTVGIGGCSDTACDDGLYCNGAETCSDPQCDPTQPGCCVAGTPPCTDGDACTSDVCTESDDTCSYPPNYDPATDCCDPATGGLMPLEDGNDCTEGVCDPATGIVVQNPLPAGTPCNDFDNCTEPDTCDGAGTCSGVQIPDCTGCQSDADCNDGVACTVDTCVNQECEFVTDDSLCADNGLYCDGREVCNQMLGCVSTGNPCPPECVEAATPHCPCETPDVSGGGPRYIAMRPRALDSTVPVKFRVDWPGEGVPCFSRYVGSLRCGGTGDACTTDADCNECSFSGVPCLTDADCDFGLCTDGQECSVSAQNCLDQSECLRSESCTISGDLCETAPLQTIDINHDGLDDGMLGVLVDAAGAVEMTPLEWSGGLMRCSKSASPCVVDADCSRGRCITTGAFCDVFVQNCFDGAECVLDEECVPGAVYVYGDDIVPSEYVAATQTHVPTTYEVTAECGLGTPPPATVVMWRWGDTSHDSFVNVTDISLILLAMQGQYDFSTKVTDDLSGSDACWVQQVLNITDVLFAKRAFQGEHYYDTACDHPTCP